MEHANREVVLAFQPPTGVDLVPLIRDDAVWAGFAAELQGSFDPDFPCAAIGTLQGDWEERGIAGIRRLWLDWLAPWQTYFTRVESVEEVDGVLMVCVRDRGLPVGGAAEVEISAASVWWVRAGVVERVEFHTTRETAIGSLRGARPPTDPAHG